MKDFESYKNDLVKQNRHNLKKTEHIISKEDYYDFRGFTEEELWGVFADYDYEKWLKEQ